MGLPKLRRGPAGIATLRGMWQWIGQHSDLLIGAAIGTAVTVIVAVWIAVWQRRPKTLDYEIRSQIGLIHPQAKNTQLNLKVTLDRKPIDEPHVFVVRIINSGKQAISADDFRGDDAIRVRYAEREPTGLQVIGASSGIDLDHPGRPDHNPIGLGFDDKGITIVPELLNAGEWFDCQFFNAGPPGDITVSARFADQTRSMRRLNKSSVKTLRLRLLRPAAMASVFLNLIFLFAMKDYPSAYSMIEGVSIIAVMIFIVGVLLSFEDGTPAKPSDPADTES